MNVITYLMLLILAYIVFTSAAVIAAKSTKAVIRLITAINIIFTILMCSMFYIIGTFNSFYG